MRRSGVVGLGLAVLAMLLTAAPALAQAPSQGGMTATEIAAWLKRNGAPAEVKPDTTTPGDQVVSTLIDGIDVDIFLYQCAGDGDARRCRSIQYAAGWTPQPAYTADRANAWNYSERYIRAYITPKGSLGAEYDVDLSPAGADEMLDHSLDNWRAELAAFKKFFGS
jgi:Putative bacterial sensory transduction regulator